MRSGGRLVSLLVKLVADGEHGVGSLACVDLSFKLYSVSRSWSEKDRRPGMEIGCMMNEVC